MGRSLSDGLRDAALLKKCADKGSLMENIIVTALVLLALIVVRPIFVGSLQGQFNELDVALIKNSFAGAVVILVSLPHAFRHRNQLASKTVRPVLVAGIVSGLFRTATSLIGVFAIWGIPSSHHLLIQVLQTSILILSDVVNRSVWSIANAISVPLGMLLIVQTDAIIGSPFGYLSSVGLLMLDVLSASVNRLMLNKWESLKNLDSSPRRVADIGVVVAALVTALLWLGSSKAGINLLNMRRSAIPILGITVGTFMSARAASWLRRNTGEALIGAFLTLSTPVLLVIEALFGQPISARVGAGMVMIIATSILSIAHNLRNRQN
ncbi:MAG: hypothetical protein AAFW75_14170 [Cyanobacteria bacterium J06636_16]